MTETTTSHLRGPHVTLRISTILRDRIAAQVERLRAEQPGYGWDRSMLIRVALELYLKDVEEVPSARLRKEAPSAQSRMTACAHENVTATHNAHGSHCRDCGLSF